jgi:hypothetical protein
MLSKGLAALTHWRQFILWKTVLKDGKLIKIPVSPHTGQLCNAHDAGSWVDADTAAAAAPGFECGVGFVFTEADPFFFLDIDKCAVDGQWSQLAQNILAMLPGAAVEISQSGNGLHIFGRTAPIEHKCKDSKLGIELYTSGRFVALTDLETVGDAATDCSASLAGVVATYFAPSIAASVVSPQDGPRADWSGPTDDAELLRRALASGGAGSIFGGKASFRDLWEANADKLGECYPDRGGTRAYDESGADMALAQHLAFWTGCDAARIQRLMNQSALAREKWERPDYLPRTIGIAVGQQKDVYNRGDGPPTVAATVESGEEIRTGYQLLTPQQQLSHFEGCVYVQDLHRVFMPSGALLRSEQFRVAKGGYVFSLNSTHDKTTKNAWEAFTESQVVRQPRADSVCFRPRLKPGTIVTEEGRTLVNTYVPVVTERAEGDATPFLAHLEKVLPVEGDRAILLAYMAACIQHKGHKFQWAPLLQGTEGNGKTLFTRCVAFAVGRIYTHYPKAADLDNKFNGWLLNKLFIAVEDIYVPDHKREVIETLKPMITGGDGLEIQFKGADQITADICANFMLNSNHKDAIQKTQSDRRFAVFYTAQQSRADIEAAGMGGDYFPKLYDWLRSGGYAIVANYLESYPIPDSLNPAKGSHRAPETSTTGEAILMSLGGVEQEVVEAIDSGRPGFAGGWVSSIWLDRLLEELRANRQIPPNRRRAVMQSIEYDWHPALTDGRVHNVVNPDGGKPKLYVKNGHINALNLKTPADVARAYEKAQSEAKAAQIDAQGLTG